MGLKGLWVYREHCSRLSIRPRVDGTPVLTTVRRRDGGLRRPIAQRRDGTVRDRSKASVDHPSSAASFSASTSHESFALHLRLASSFSSGGTQHSAKQHELARTGRRARSQHGGYLANGSEAARVGPEDGARVTAAASTSTPHHHSTSGKYHQHSSSTSNPAAPPDPPPPSTRRCGACTVQASNPSATSRRSPPSRRPSVLAPASHSHGQGHAPSQSDSPSSAGHSSHTHMSAHSQASNTSSQQSHSSSTSEFVGDEFGEGWGSDTQSRFFTTYACRFRCTRATALLIPRRALRAVRCAPHGVAGKVAGKDVGMWFGPIVPRTPYIYLLFILFPSTLAPSPLFSSSSPLSSLFPRLPPGRDSPSLLALKTDYVTSAYPHPSFPCFVLPSISPIAPGINKTSIIDVFPFLSLVSSSPAAPSVWRRRLNALLPRISSRSVNIIKLSELASESPSQYDGINVSPVAQSGSLALAFVFDSSKSYLIIPKVAVSPG
ncbi:hypothetical protein DFH08DRAFT_973498 [Mycena albidolilacea]|uniref:Uncharacterized protein n=1 Tax=Mycena albidolilacea TaxID=1033008 RepID=A0AAD6Z8W0_9AGAR|nr:hypothetical protein DFH08DRAFT_973498 [Mycena albidolilacea]